MAPREMKKALAIILLATQCVVANSAMAAVSVKKAAPVATKQVEKTTSVASLLPTVMNLVGTVQGLKAQQKALTDECVPTSDEITFVDKTMREWAKTGEMSADEVMSRLGRTRCAAANGYAASARIAAATESNEVCMNFFGGAGNDGTVWMNYPKVGIVSDLCTDGTTTCSDKKTVSDIYDIFNIISFTEKDYDKSEAQKAMKLTNKIEKCSNAKLSARKKELWGNFLTSTISTIGQKQNTGSVMDMVGGLAGSMGASGGGIGGALGGLGNIGNIASGLFGQ